MGDHGGMKMPPCLPALALFGLSLLGACTHPENTKKARPSVSLEMSTLLSRMDTLGQVRFPMLRPGSVLPAEMNRPLRWEWTGTVDDGVRLIAQIVGYTVISSPVPNCPVVSIHQSQTTAGELINQLAAAGNPELDVDVDILHHTIRINQHA